MEPRAPGDTSAGLSSEVQAALSGYTLDDLAEALSLDTWNKLPADARASLVAATLPLKPDDPSLSALLEREVFTTSNRFFGNPLGRFWHAFVRGGFSAETLGAEEREDAQRQQERVEWEREHHNSLVHRLHHLKRTFAPPRTGGTSRPGGGASSSEQPSSSRVSGGAARRAAPKNTGVDIDKSGAMGGCQGTACATACDASAACAAPTAPLAPPRRSFEVPQGMFHEAGAGGGTDSSACLPREASGRHTPIEDEEDASVSEMSSPPDGDDLRSTPSAKRQKAARADPTGSVVR
jgi:hypothetical protein